MKNYKYPKAQNVCNDTVFIMQSTFDLNIYESYTVPIKTDTETICKFQFLHTVIERYILNAPGAKMRLHNFAQGKPFIKLPIRLGKKI